MNGLGGDGSRDEKMGKRGRVNHNTGYMETPLDSLLYNLIKNNNKTLLERRYPCVDGLITLPRSHRLPSENPHAYL